MKKEKGEGMKEKDKRMNGERPRDLKDRTKEFALRIVRLYAALPVTTIAQVLG
jgi:transposase-like protein